MKKIILVALSAFMIMALAGCGDGGTTVVVTPPPVAPPVLVTTDILSDPFSDGTIPSDTLIANHSSNTQNVVAGIDPNIGVEYRAFLDFPLTGAGGVPGNAIIDSAFLDIFINNVFPQSIPLQIDLVSFPPPMIGSDFNRPALRTISVIPSISPAAIGSHVSIDVTPLMVEAQRLGLLDFQIRIMEDLRFNTLGLIEINNTTGVNRGTLAPLLTVTYF